MSETQKYTVNADGWVAGLFRKKGDSVELTDAEAKYEANITPQQADAPKTATKAKADK